MRAMKNTIFTLLAMATFALPAFATDNQAKVPAKAISPDTVYVGYANIDNLTVESLKASAHALTAAIPDSSKAMRKQMDAMIEAGMAKFKKKFVAVTHAGVHALLVGMDSKSVNGGKPSNFTLFKAGKSATAASMTAMVRKSSADAGPSTASAVRFQGNWFAVKDKEDQVPQNGGDTAAASKFQKLLNNAGNAPVRFAFVMNQTIRRKMQKAKAQDPQNPLGAMAGPVGAMQNATIAFQPGKSPTLDLNMNFPDAKSAQAAQSSIKNALMMFQGFAQMQLSNMPNGPKPALIQALFQNLEPTINGKQLAVGLHGKFVNNLGKILPSFMKMYQQMQQMRAMQQQQGGGMAPHQMPPQRPQY